MINLVVEDKALYTSWTDIVDDELKKYYKHENPILLFYYPSNEIDTISWPNPNEEHLRGALFDARETGVIPDVKTVLLPDGTEFVIDK